MKKLIAIAVVFALVMGGVFAETSVGGFTVGKITLGQGETGTDSKASGGASVRLQLSGQNEEGTFGGQFRVDGDAWLGASRVFTVKDGDDTVGTFTQNWSGLKDLRSNVWWKPIDILKIQLGPGLDGSFGVGDANTGWGFYAGVNDLDIWNYSGFNGDGFGGTGTNGTGLLLSVYPISGLDVNMFLPFNGTKDVLDVYKKFYAEVVYKIDNIGTVKAGFQSNTFDLGNPARIGVSFDLSALNAMGLSLAFKLHTGFPTADDDAATTRTEWLYMNLGVGYTAGDFNVKLRFKGQFLGKTTIGDAEPVKDDAMIGFGLFPNYKVGNLFVGVGFDVRVDQISDDETKDPRIIWHTSPFVQYSVGPGKFQMGLNVGTTSGAKDKLRWEIPLRIGFNF